MSDYEKSWADPVKNERAAEAKAEMKMMAASGPARSRIVTIMTPRPLVEGKVLVKVRDRICTQSWQTFASEASDPDVTIEKVSFDRAVLDAILSLQERADIGHALTHRVDDMLGDLRSQVRDLTRQVAAAAQGVALLEKARDEAKEPSPEADEELAKGSFEIMQRIKEETTAFALSLIKRHFGTRNARNVKARVQVWEGDAS